MPPRTAQAQIVSTLTQFPTVQRVSILVDGKQVPLENGAGRPVVGGAAASDYADLTADALIFVREPARDSTVSTPVRASGTANVYEATLQVEIWRGGELVDTAHDHGNVGLGHARHVVGDAAAAERRREAALLRTFRGRRLAPARDGGPAPRPLSLDQRPVTTHAEPGLQCAADRPR